MYPINKDEGGREKERKIERESEEWRCVIMRGCMHMNVRVCFILQACLGHSNLVIPIYQHIHVLHYTAPHYTSPTFSRQGGCHTSLRKVDSHRRLLCYPYR